MLTLNEARTEIATLVDMYPEKLIALGIGDLNVSDEFLSKVTFITEQCYLGRRNVTEKEMFEKILLNLVKKEILNEKQN